MNDEPSPPGPVDVSTADVERVPDTRAALELVRSSALELIAGFPLPPSALRIRAGGVTIEAEWPVSGEPVASAGGAAPASGDDTVRADDTRRSLCAPTVGVFYRSPEPGAKPFVEVGDTVVADQQVAIVEVMKLMFPVKTDVDSRIVEILKENGQPVEYGEPLFRIAPLGP